MTAIERQSAEVRDIALAYLRAGEGDPVVLLHGWPQHSGAWKRVIPALAERHTVIAPDLRGFGASAKPAGGYDTDNAAADVHELLRGLGFDRVHLAGHDWGAVVAYSYACQWRAEARSLSVFEMLMPGFGLIEQAMVPRPGGDFIWHIGFHSVPEVPEALIAGREDYYLEWFFASHTHQPGAVSAADTADYVRAMRAEGALRAGLGYYRSFFESAAQNERHRERPLAIPVQGWGGEVSLGPLVKQGMELGATEVSGGVIERCGHWIGEEQPEFVAARLLDFCAASA